MLKVPISLHEARIIVKHSKEYDIKTGSFSSIPFLDILKLTRILGNGCWHVLHFGHKVPFAFGRVIGHHH